MHRMQRAPVAPVAKSRMLHFITHFRRILAHFLNAPKMRVLMQPGESGCLHRGLHFGRAASNAIGVHFDWMRNECAKKHMNARLMR